MRLNGKDQDVQVIGTDEFYKPVRNMLVLSGRFLDSSDVALRQKVCLLTEKLAQRLYGSTSAAVGNVIKIHELQFTVIGTFKEKVESFGQSELGAETILIPITVLRYFTQVERIDPLYVQVRSPDDVEAVTAADQADSREPAPSGRALPGAEPGRHSGCRARRSRPF